ncbi:hypothetical protein METEAL_31430 [Mesoterricola silvestris]|uniref:Uncharacterized protein n=2 Tax=Mesoterricola silvestris TaxID=2927979 RepID=A0AA48K9G1_9BACT|nr:hypothetical protein METEAL_31430 [Mesoterricola silvestris]
MRGRGGAGGRGGGRGGRGRRAGLGGGLTRRRGGRLRGRGAAQEAEELHQGLQPGGGLGLGEAGLEELGLPLEEGGQDGGGGGGLGLEGLEAEGSAVGGGHPHQEPGSVGEGEIALGGEGLAGGQRELEAGAGSALEQQVHVLAQEGVEDRLGGRGEFGQGLGGLDGVQEGGDGALDGVHGPAPQIWKCLRRIPAMSCRGATWSTQPFSKAARGMP